MFVSDWYIFSRKITVNESWTDKQNYVIYVLELLKNFKLCFFLHFQSNAASVVIVTLIDNNKFKTFDYNILFCRQPRKLLQ